ncbi:MAG: CHAD domain-containing protein [Chloroflexi bacterium]|nr:CHAD domain-containing protein [Chloroflexota bacterium]
MENNQLDEIVSEIETPKVLIVPMRPGEPLSEAGRAVLLKHLEKLRKNEQLAREGNVEGVHDMRVATRRLRAGLKVLEKTVYKAEQVGKFRRSLRTLANALGDTRDSDVLLEHLERYAATLPSEKLVEIEPLRQSITDRREAGQRHILRTLDNKATAKLFNKLEAFLTTPSEGLRKSPSDKNEAAPLLVRHFSGSVIWRCYEEVLAYETKLPANIEVLHRLRVACKRFRYTLEFFEEALPGQAKPLIQQLVKAQDHLGTLHDHQVAIERVERLEKQHPDDLALVDYATLRAKERDQLYSQFETLWLALSGADFRRSLAAILSGEEVANPKS